MLEQLWKKILRRRPVSIWTVPAFGLWIASLIFRIPLLFRRRHRGGGLRLSLPVISVGNMTVGGTGKTPIVELLGRFLSDEGLKVGIVSSGYGRREKTGLIAPGYKIQKMDVAAVSDEVMYLAWRLPRAVFSIDPSKAAAAAGLAEAGQVDLIIVDDGFQHLALERDLDIVCFDAAVNIRLLNLLPYGTLREPLSAIKRADLVIITRSNFAQDLKATVARVASLAPDSEVYQARFWMNELVGRQGSRPLKYLEDKSVFLFAGIASFETLRRQVDALSGDLDYALELGDHQEYDRATLQRIKRMADRFGSDLIVTTGKDWFKLGDFDFGREMYYLTQTIDLDPGEEKLTASLLQRLQLPARHR